MSISNRAIHNANGVVRGRDIHGTSGEAFVDVHSWRTRWVAISPTGRHAWRNRGEETGRHKCRIYELPASYY